MKTPLDHLAYGIIVLAVFFAGLGLIVCGHPVCGTALVIAAMFGCMPGNRG